MKYNPPTTIDMLRHGECHGGDIYRGHTNDELTNFGWQHMHNALTHYEQQPPWNQIICSPLKRCLEFSEWLGEQHQIPISTVPELKEMNFGRWDGKTRKEVWQAQPERVKNFMADPVKFPPPKGENLIAFQKRVLKGFTSLLKPYQGKHLLLVLHGGTIRIILSHLLKIPLDKVHRLDVPYAALSRIKIYHEEDAIFPLLIFHNHFHDQAARHKSKK